MLACMIPLARCEAGKVAHFVLADIGNGLICKETLLIDVDRISLQLTDYIYPIRHYFA